MKTHRYRIGNEQELKGRYEFVSATAGVKTDSATAALTHKAVLPGPGR